MKRLNAITDVPGIEVGHTSDFNALTGCTVILCEEGAVGGVDIRGTATGTREIDALTLLHLVDKIHAILLAGGSAFGLDAAGGVMAFNTTLGIIATNANLSKKEVHQVAQIAHSGLAKMISPIHSSFEGDLVFAISYGKKKADVNTIGLLGEAALMEAVKRAVTKADGFGVIPSYKDLAV